MKKLKIDFKTRTRNFCEGLDKRQRNIVVVLMFAILIFIFLFGTINNYNRYKQSKQSDLEFTPIILDTTIPETPLDSRLLNHEKTLNHDRK